MFQEYDPSYISQSMFDEALQERFLENASDESVRLQASQLLRLLRGSRMYQQVLVDIGHAAQVSRRTSTEQTAEIAFCMGLQFGFELAVTYPPRR
jgi:hypothetical protein